MEQLTATLKKIEKQNYRAYQKIRGEYDFGDYRFLVDQVQADPHASASRVRAIRPWSLTGLEWLLDKSQAYQIAARDFIGRHFAQLSKQENSIDISLTGQTVLDSTAVLFTDEGIELRFRVNLPAEGRSVLGKKAINLLTFHLPKYIRRSTLERELDKSALTRHCEVIEDQEFMRDELDKLGLISFVGNGSILPRIAGNCDLPMEGALPFQAPESMTIDIITPNQGKISGLGIKKGITLIVGGGFHGKSTLLNAIERSVYNHIPGDGRETIVSNHDTYKIRAEDGRCIHGLNLSNYINHLPMGRDTTNFSTQDASGSTSQAAWLQESVEAGVQGVLLDEDTSATNFMIRDERMQALVCKGEEPITPLVDRIGQLRDSLGISTILVMGGSGDYFDVADHVIQMHAYQAIDVTQKAKEVIKQHPTQRSNESECALSTFAPRKLNRSVLQKILADGKFKISAKGTNSLRFGKEHIDLSALEQLESSSEINAIGWLWFELAQISGVSDNPTQDIRKILDEGWTTNMPVHGDLAKPRALDVIAALNRMRKARFQ